MLYLADSKLLNFCLAVSLRKMNKLSDPADVRNTCPAGIQPFHSFNFSALFRSLFQASSPSTRKDTHEAKASVEQSQWVCHKQPHIRHSSRRTKYRARGIGRPGNCSRSENVAKQRIQWHQYANQAGQTQGQQTVAQCGGASRESQGATEVPASSRKATWMVS